ncbi:hypothetical protein ACLB2K_022271 [Fragaria x ananassa]
MMLLIGMKMSLTKKPTNPITTNPIAVRSHLGEFCIKITPQIKTSKIQQESIEIYKEEREIGGVIFAIGLWQRLTRRMESLKNSLRGSTTESMASMSSFLRANLREKKKKKKKKKNKIWEICIYLVHHSVAQGNWRGLQVCDGASMISHLLFADDIMLYANALPRILRSAEGLDDYLDPVFNDEPRTLQLFPNLYSK